MATRSKRKMRTMSLIHIPYDGRVAADDVQGIRAFGSESELETVGAIVNKKLKKMRADHETTFEHLKMGALQGKILDADGSTVLHNLFTIFGITETTVDVDMTPAVEGTTMKTMLTIKRAIEDAMGQAVFSGYHILAGKTWFDSFVANPDVTKAYARWRDGEFLMRDQRRAPFQYQDVDIQEYRGKVGSVDFIPDAQARAFPVGASDLFVNYIGPADMMETVNTMGQRIYAKQELEAMGRGVKIHTQSNCLPVCLRPAALIKLTLSA